MSHGTVRFESQELDPSREPTFNEAALMKFRLYKSSFLKLDENHYLTWQNEVYMNPVRKEDCRVRRMHVPEGAPSVDEGHYQDH